MTLATPRTEEPSETDTSAYKVWLELLEAEVDATQHETVEKMLRMMKWKETTLAQLAKDFLCNAEVLQQVHLRKVDGAPSDLQDMLIARIEERAGKKTCSAGSERDEVGDGKAARGGMGGLANRMSGSRCRGCPCRR